MPLVRQRSAIIQGQQAAKVLLFRLSHQGVQLGREEDFGDTNDADGRLR
jgi:hypothetical protein